MKQDPALPGLLHDLNNIFQTLVDAADLLSEDPRWQPISAAILRSVERGRCVTMSLQAVRSPGVPFETILGNAIAFVEDARLAAPGPVIRFACDVEPDIELPGNWAWERVLINLFLNAMRAMPQGGEIQVEARRFCDNASGYTACIVVRDSGSGIPAQILDRLFEPGVSTKTDGLGQDAGSKPAAGLGLQVVESIVRQDGGSVRAANRIDGPGAEFTITLPARASSRPAHA
jgi:signal transduction histidine kinase